MHFDDPPDPPPRPAGRPARGAPERLLTVPDAAEALQVSSKTVRRLIARGELSALRVGRQLRIPPRDLHAYLRGRLLEA